MITKCPINAEQATRQARFFPSARLAWGACLRGLMPRRVLLPAYIGYTDREGSGVLDPVCELEIPFSFFAVGRDLLADPATIEQSLIREPEIDLVLLIHYFGWPGGDVAAIRSICDEANVLLVEDCAHAFQWGHSDPSLGILGDYAFFSIHKHLACASGGVLHSVKGSYPVSMFPEQEPIDLSALDILARADLSAIAKMRRENLLRALEGIANIEGLHPIRSDIPLVPQSLPVWVEGEMKREKLYFQLMERGVPTTALYYRLHPSLKPEHFPHSFEVSDHILNLPIHQDMSADGIDFMLREIQAALTGAR